MFPLWNWKLMFLSLVLLWGINYLCFLSLPVQFGWGCVRVPSMFAGSRRYSTLTLHFEINMCDVYGPPKKTPHPHNTLRGTLSPACPMQLTLCTHAWWEKCTHQKSNSCPSHFHLLSSIETAGVLRSLRVRCRTSTSFPTDVQRTSYSSGTVSLIPKRGHAVHGPHANSKKLIHSLFEPRRKCILLFT